MEQPTVTPTAPEGENTDEPPPYPGKQVVEDEDIAIEDIDTMPSAPGHDPSDLPPPPSYEAALSINATIHTTTAI